MIAVSRDEIAQVLRRWQARELDAAAVLAWVEARWPRDDARFLDEEPAPGVPLSVAREVLAELDLLAVHLLTVEDVPALEALLAAPPGHGAPAVEAFRRYRAAIDRKERSRRLKRDPLYRPFCV